MWIERKDGDFLYRFLNKRSDSGIRSSGSIAPKVSQRVAFDTMARPRKTLPSASRTPTARWDEPLPSVSISFTWIEQVPVKVWSAGTCWGFVKRQVLVGFSRMSHRPPSNISFTGSSRYPLEVGRRVPARAVYGRQVQVGFSGMSRRPPSVSPSPELSRYLLESSRQVPATNL